MSVNDPHDSEAFAHYEALIAQRYPPQLAAALVAARYQVRLMQPKPAPAQPPVDKLPIIKASPAKRRRS